MKRFTATEKWEKPWYQELPPHIKCLWQYICDKCDAAGVWEPNWKVASLSIGKTVSAADLKHFEGRIATFKGGKIVIGSFVEFQYGKLSRECRAHFPIFRLIEKHTLSIGYQKAIHSLQEQEQEQEEETEEEEETETGTPITPPESPFDKFWRQYPRRVGKGDAEKAWGKHGCDKILENILAAVDRCKVSADWKKNAGEFIPHPATWLNRRGWEDELLPASNGDGKTFALTTPGPRGWDPTKGPAPK